MRQSYNIVKAHVRAITVGCSILLVALYLCASLLPKYNNLPTTPRPEASEAMRPAQYGRLPLSFEANQGQVASPVKFLSRGDGYNLYLTPGEAVLALKAGQPERAAVLRMALAGANRAPQIDGLEMMAGKSNYFLGNDPAAWRTDIPHFSKVCYQDVYPDIDMVFYGNQRTLEYDLLVAPGADPEIIAIKFTGAEELKLDKDGNLLLSVNGGTLIQHKPVIYQEAEGRRETIEGHYVIHGQGEVGFNIGAYDKSKTLVIDPMLSYATFLGGMGAELGSDLVVDAAGNLIITGDTDSLDFPTLNGAQPANAGMKDVFITKLNATGSALVYSTYLGGAGNDLGRDITMDSAGNAYISGRTDSDNFPTLTPFQAARGGGQDAFIAKLSANGNAIIYSSYLGGAGDEDGLGVDIDSAGAAYLTGQTTSTNFPTTAGAFSTTFNGGLFDAFATKVASAGGTIVYSTYLGGAADDNGRKIAVDSAGNAFLTGFTTSTNFPTTAGALQTALSGAQDAYITKLNATGSAPVYSTFLGGSGMDTSFNITIDGAGNAYITGGSDSLDFPAVNAVQGFGGTIDAIVAKLNAAGNALVFSTYLGGASTDQGINLAVDTLGRTTVTGRTMSTNFPTANPLIASNSGADDIFITQLNAAGNGFIYSTYYGGANNDFGLGIDTDSAGNVYVGGQTFSSDLPTTTGSFQTAFAGMADAFVLKLVTVPGSLAFSFANYNVNENGAIVMITVNRMGGADGTVTIDYATANNTAVAGSDYTATSGTLTFAPGVTSQSFSVPILDDMLDEANETINLSLANATGGATLGTPSTATITIADNDPPPTLSIADTSVVEGNVGNTTAIFTVTLSPASGQTVTVDFATANGAALAGSDFASASGTLTFPPGSTTQTVNVAVAGETIFENNEDFFVNLTNPVNATIADGQALGTITNDDTPPTVSINDISVTEGNSGTVKAGFTVTLSAASGLDVKVDLTTAPGSATANTDYQSDTTTGFTIAAGTTSRTISVPVIGDQIDEPSETFTYNLSNPVNATIGKGQGIATIIDDDGTPGISITDVSANETDSGTTSFTFTVSLSNTSGQTVTVDYATAPGSASATADYTPAAGTLTFAPGVTSQPIVIAVNGDALNEADETFFVNLSKATNAAILKAQGRGLIVNDDALPLVQFSVNAYAVTEGSNAAITILRTANSNGAVTVNLTTNNGSATIGSDFADASGVLTFADGETSKTVAMTIVDDNIVEGDETVNLLLSNPSGGGLALASALLTIKDNDVAQPGQLQFSAAAYNTTEDAGSVTVTVTRTGGSNVPVSVFYSTSDGSATNGSDYGEASGLLSFATGVTSQSFSIRIFDDASFEGNETINLTLTAPGGGATLGATARAAVTIADNDLDPSLNVPVLQVDQARIDFGSLLIGSSATRMLMIRNAGRADLKLAAPLLTGFGSQEFSIAQPPATLTLAPGQSTALTVAFKPALPSRLPVSATLILNSNGGTITVQMLGSGFDDVAPSAAVTAPAGGETITAGAPFTIRYTGSDNDIVGGFIISLSTDGGASFGSDIARLGGTLNEVIWNVPELLESSQARIRVIARDRAGNQTVALSNTFTIRKPSAPPAVTLQVMITFDPPPMGQVAPPQNVKVLAGEMRATAIQPAAEGDLPVELIGYNIYRVPAPPAGQPLPTADEIVGNPANLIGSVGAASTSFTDMVTTNSGQNFVYSITSFFGGGQMSGGSMPTSTDLPVIKNPRFQKGTILLEAAGSFIKDGAVLIVNDNDSYALQFDSSGALLTVPKKLKGSGGRTIKKVIRKGAMVRLMVRNPDGKLSVGVLFTR